MAEMDPATTLGTARCPGTGWNDLMAQDSRPAPACLTEESYAWLGSEPLDAARYTSEAFAEAERRHMWPHVWQFCAREEDILEPGDYIVYENAGRSYIVSRQDDGSVRALHNVCLHRGRKLRDGDGATDRFVCPFHGFAWHKDGAFDSMPCRWDFAHLTNESLALPQAEVGRWGGYIFLREEPGGPTLEEFLAPLPEHFKRWRHEECTTVIWVAKEVAANWKVTAEAFMEAWHTIITHPQLLPFTGDCNSAYWFWGDHVNVNLVPFGVLSPHLDPDGKSQQWIVDEFIKFNGRSSDNYDPNSDPYAVSVPEGQSARAALGAALRKAYAAQTGYDHEHATDSELLDALVYNVFPNFAPWGGYMPNIVYRWLPGKTPDTCVMDVRVLARVRKGEPIPRGVPRHYLTLDQKWTEAKELGGLGDVFEQDMDNLPFVQQGLHASKTGRIQLANYQEIRLRQFHRTMDKYLSGELGGVR
ncbi:MAG TPA: aromatic ring-hydroxylating dioxygenase subunit alpha [Novosphingobium sp.]